jgi:threonine dehydrogenase-like Zn-dependent dehydrogenase
MRALVFGVPPEPFEVPDDANTLTRNLAHSPLGLRDVPDPQPLHDDWVVTRPRLTGICGSDSKQILLDFGEGDTDNAMAAFCSFPQVMGHEVVADVVALGPTARGLEIGQRVVLNPWLSCGPRGIEPPCPACETGDYSLCWSFTDGDIKPGIHTGVSADVTGGYAELMPAHDSMLFAVPDSVPDEVAVFADPFSVSLHAITRHPPPPTGRVLVYGPAPSGCVPWRCCARCTRRSLSRLWRASTPRRSWHAGSVRTRCWRTNPASPSSRSSSRGAVAGCDSRCRGCRWPTRLDRCGL